MSFVALITLSASKATKAKRTHHVTNWKWQTEMFCFAAILLCSGNTNRLSKTAEYEIYLQCFPRNSTWFYFPCYRLTVVTDGWINFRTIKRCSGSTSCFNKTEITSQRFLSSPTSFNEIGPQIDLRSYNRVTDPSKASSNTVRHCSVDFRNVLRNQCEQIWRFLG